MRELKKCVYLLVRQCHSEIILYGIYLDIEILLKDYEKVVQANSFFGDVCIFEFEENMLQGTFVKAEEIFFIEGYKQVSIEELRRE